VSSKDPLPELSEREHSVELVLLPDDHARLANLCGQFDEHLRQVETRLGLSIRSRGNRFELRGPEVQAREGGEVLERLYELTGEEDLSPEKVHLTISAVTNQIDASRSVIIHARRRDIFARGKNQMAYARAMRESDLTFGVGPAGTGKTYLAVAAAVEALNAESVRRLVLVRPAVEAGERLGFLPGDMSQKIDPYLRPMYDALYEMLGFDRVGRLIDRHIIEVAPLAFMRGRTLNESFVILDEAQNTTPEQMKMFLTRIGFGSRAVVTGDLTQTDLPAGRESGLKQAVRILEGVDGISFVHFEARDVVRHPLVQKIVAAYGRADEPRNPSR
jgi:phosphate starvation-inducible protein PhoH and related proteins